MATKADFTPEEWQSILQAPMAIGALITLSSPAMGDAIKESMAVASAIAKAAQDADGNALVAALAAEYTDRATAKAAQPDLTSRDPAEVKAQLLGVVTAAGAALGSKAGADDVAQVKAWLYSLGEAAANAAKEGDFMGIGGQRVSPEEEAALAEIKGALGL
jgi:hypothetical protein